jgi:hypothetical protein
MIRSKEVFSDRVMMNDGSSTLRVVESPRVRGITKIRGQEKAVDFWNVLSGLKD